MALLRKKQPDLPRRRQASQVNAVRPEASIDDSSVVFRRNRTLTGSTSSKINVTQGSKNDLASPRAQAHSLTIQRRKVGGTLFVIFVIVAAISWLLFEFTGTPTIVVSDASMSTSLDSARYVKVIQQYLDSNPIERLRIGLNNAALSSYVSTALPEVSAVQQKGISGFGKTDFLLTMRKPLAGWKIGDSQYYVDASGVPFQVNYYSTPSVQIDDQSGVGLIAGKAVVSDSFLSFVGKVVSASTKYGYQVTTAIIPPGTTRQLEIQLSGYSPLIKLSIDRGATEQVEDMSRSIKFLQSKGITPQYIDVRVSGKAFYL